MYSFNHNCDNNVLNHNKYYIIIIVIDDDDAITVKIKLIN